MSTPADEFRLKEFESLRKEIEFHLTSMGRSDDYCLLAVGAVWAWLFTSQLSTTAAALLPGIIALLFYFKRVCLELVLTRHFHVYLKEKVEGEHFKIEGWEHFIHDKQFLIRWWYHVYYLGMVIGSLLIAALFISGLASVPVVPPGKQAQSRAEQSVAVDRGGPRRVLPIPSLAA